MGERPVECSHCKKQVKVLYKEIVGETITLTEMCADCPILQQKLHGPVEGLTEGHAGICCAACGTSLESIKTGNPVGCSQCYSVFSDVLVGELAATSRLPPQLEQAKKNQPLHVGKTPGAPVTFVLSDQLKSLGDALNMALKNENYEQAASLRDQIKTLMEKKDAGQK